MCDSESKITSYCSNARSLCWFPLPELKDSICHIFHNPLGNVVTEGRHLVVENGSTQLSRQCSTSSSLLTIFLGLSVSRLHHP